MRKPAVPVALCLLLAGLFGLAQGDPASLPARDEHEGLLVAADPHTDPERVKKIFGKKSPLDVGIVPIEVIFRNDNDKPILMNLESIELVLNPTGGRRQRVAPLAVEDVIDKTLRRGSRDVTMKRLPIPGRASKDKDWLKLESIIRPVALEMSLLPPKATVRGFLFFNVGQGIGWLSHSRLFVADLRFMHNKQPLFFFEMDLSKALP
jgi:hypothetical protein